MSLHIDQPRLDHKKFLDLDPFFREMKYVDTTSISGTQCGKVL